MHNLGLLLKDGDPQAARGWYERAAAAGHADAMTNLGVLLADSDPQAARGWYERAAAAGHTSAMHNLIWPPDCQGRSTKGPQWRAFLLVGVAVAGRVRDARSA